MRQVPTSDDWYPTPSDGLVEGFVLLDDDGFLRVAFWGGDDFGLELDCEGAGREDYDRWVGWMGRLAVVCVNSLRQLGFKTA